jgi:acyl-CoA synthetase (AMP-forming)/AMP-acid ligase II
MENIITRHCINPEMLIHQHDEKNTLNLVKTWNYTEFCETIDFWKTILVEKYNAQPGQTIYVQCGPNVYYYAAIFAALELGLSLIVDWPHIRNDDDLKDYKVTVFGKIDFIIVNRDLHDPTSDIYFPGDHKRDLMFGKNIIFQEDFDTYTIKDTELYNRMSTTFLAKPDDVLVYSFTPGTTGAPKKIQDTHKKVYLTAKRLGKLLFEPGSSLLHTRTLHHGASMCYHFLPGFMTGKEHFTCSILENLPTFVKRYSINQLFLYSPIMATEFLQELTPVEHRLNITTIYQITPEILQLVKEKNINFIKSAFGDTTIGLGFFIKHVDQTTDPDSYNVSNMGPILDDFFQIELRDGLLYVCCPAYDTEWKTSDDLFELVGRDYYFKGRSNRYRINGEWIDLTQIEKAVGEYFGVDGANIVLDIEQQKIYLAIWESNDEAEAKINKFFNENYDQVKISYVLRNEIYTHYDTSRAIDNSKLRLVCREKLLNSKTK